MYMDTPIYDPVKLAGNAGRMKLQDYIKRDYHEFFDYLMSSPMYDGLDFKERMYWFYNGVTEHPTCKTCGKPTKFHGASKGYSEHCCARCTQLDKDVRDKNISTVIETYGEDYKSLFVERGRRTKIERHGDPNYNNHTQAVKTCIERHGEDNPMKCEKFKKKSREKCLEKYGSEYYFSSDEARSRREEFDKKRIDTNIRDYGFPYATQNPEVKKKISDSVMDVYEVPWSCLRSEAHHHRLDSKKSELFKKLLSERGIEYSTEFRIEDRTFDFKTGNVLVEINPSATHNVNYNPFSRRNPDKKLIITPTYHKEKSELANKYGYHCIHVWDWDNYGIIADMLAEKDKIYARECEIRDVDKKSADEFLNTNHLQGSCRGQKVRLGLFFDGELVELMTFGDPRYNDNYSVELLRLCSKRRTLVVGGAEKLFKSFLDNHKPESIVSYCDLCKFNGNVYDRLGFVREGGKDPSLHWVDPRDPSGKRHFTNQLLNQLGADKLIGTNCGKGTDNSKIMLENNYVQIYDCGQARYVYKRNSD